MEGSQNTQHEDGVIDASHRWMNCRLLESPPRFEGELYLSAAEYVSSSLAVFDMVVTILELTRVVCRNVRSGALLKRVLDPSHTLLDFACT